MRPDAEMRAELVRFVPWNRRIILTVLALFGLPPTLLDVGSGIGTMVRLARALGVDAVGIDVLADEPDIRHDLTTRLDLDRVFELIISLETAEHLPPEAAETFCDNISRHAAPGSILVFSAAVPGQGGIGHLNLQEPHYWHMALHSRGFNRRPAETQQLSQMFAMTSGPAAAYLPRNVQVFQCGS